VRFRLSERHRKRHRSVTRWRRLPWIADQCGSAPASTRAMRSNAIVVVYPARRAFTRTTSPGVSAPPSIAVCNNVGPSERARPAEWRKPNRALSLGVSPVSAGAAPFGLAFGGRRRDAGHWA
jgi:hypothetical protein